MKPLQFTEKQPRPNGSGFTLSRGWLVAALLAGLMLAACGAPSESRVRLAIFPESAELEPGQSLRFSVSVSGEFENSVTWSATGGFIEGSGEEITYRASAWDGDYEVRVASSTDPSKFAVASVRVQAIALEDRFETVDVGGGVVAVPSGAIAAFPSATLIAATAVRLRTYDRLVSVELPEFDAIGYEAVVDVPVASLDLADGRVFYIGVPSRESVSGATSAIVTVTLDGAEPQRLWASYDPTEENAVQLFAEELKALFAEHGSTPTTIRIAVQPVEHISGQRASSEVAAQSNGTRMQGLHRVSNQGLMSQARTICSSKVQNTPWAGITVPTNSPAVLPTGKVPLVLVHGWQELGITTSRAKESYHPALCAWLDYIEEFRNSEELGDQYELFSYGYDSRISIADNARQFGSVLSNVFGDTSVVVVGHSMGGMISNRVLQRNLGGSIHHLVTLGSPQQGSRFVLCEENDGDRCTKARAAAGASSWVGNLFSQRGTLDLAWQFAGVSYTTATCSFEERYCGPTSKESEANSYLADQNSSLNPIDYRNYTAVYGTKPGTGAMAASGHAIDNVGYLNDGIVPVRSACLSRAAALVFDNTCSYTVVGNSPRTFFLDHNELKGRATFSAVEEVLLRVFPEPEEPIESGPSEPGAFTLDAPTAFCNDTFSPAIRLTWSPSDGVEAYEIHRDDGLYYELETLVTSFENTANITPGWTYTYFVRARNSSGETDSNTVVGIGPIGCDPPIQVLSDGWARQFGGPDHDVGYDVAADKDGNVVIVGRVVQAGPVNWREVGFVHKYAPDGAIIWQHYFYLANGVTPVSLAIDDDNNVLLAGFVSSTRHGGTTDVFVRKIDEAGKEIWTREFGALGLSQANSVATDSRGNVVVVGSSIGGIGGPHAGGRDAFVRKYDAQGEELWTYGFGAADDDEALAVAIDGFDQILVAGVVAPAFLSNTRHMEAFLRKFDESGNVLWAQNFGSEEAGSFVGKAVAVDGELNVLIAGTAYAPLHAVDRNRTDAFVRKYDTEGNQLWAHQFGTDGDEEVTAIAIGAGGSIVVVGTTTNGLDGVYAALHDVFARSFDASGNGRWEYQFGVDGVNGATGVAVTGNEEEVFIAGYTARSLAAPNMGGFDVFLRKYIR